MVNIDLDQMKIKIGKMDFVELIDGLQQQGEYIGQANDFEKSLENGKIARMIKAELVYRYYDEKDQN